MLEPARRKEILAELLAASDGTRADDYATLSTEFEDMQAEEEKNKAAIQKLTEQNAALKKENFRLFERVGVASPPEPDVPPTTPEPTKDYLKEVMDDHGFFRK